MKPAAFDYAKPASAADAVKLLAAGEGGAKVIAGGQSLGPMLNLRLARPQLLVDVRRIPELNEVRQTPGGFFVGSCVTHAAIEDGAVPDFTRGLMKKVAGGIAYRAVRNQGTLGGSVCHADPAADWISAMLLLSAVAIVEGPAGRAEIGFDRFVTGPFSTQLDPAQILVGLRVPGVSEHARWSYCKFCRKPGEFAEAIGALLRDDRSGTCRAVIGGGSARPRVIEDAWFIAERYDPERVAAALESADGTDDRCEAQLRSAVLGRAASQLAAA